MALISLPVTTPVGGSGTTAEQNSDGTYNIGNSALDVIGSLSNDFQGVTAANRFSAEQARLSREHISNESRIAREHELYMSNTAYQRAAEDMKRAGINPATLSGMASGGSPASTGSAGASGSAMASGKTGSNNLVGDLIKMVGLLAVLAG